MRYVFHFHMTLFLMFFTQQSFADAVGDAFSCEIDPTQIQQRVDDYIRLLTFERSENLRAIVAAESLSSGRGLEAKSIEDRRNSVDGNTSNDSDGCAPRFIANIVAPVRNNCNYDAAKSSCPSFNQHENVQALQSSAERSLYGMGRLNLKPEGRAPCDSFNEVRDRLVTARTALLDSRRVVYAKYESIKSGNNSCSNAVQENVISDACVDSLNPEVGESAAVHNQLKESAQYNCFDSSMKAVGHHLTNFLKDNARRTCEILSMHQQAVADERSLFNTYKRLDMSINHLDEKIIEVHASAQQISCKLRERDVAANGN